MKAIYVTILFFAISMQLLSQTANDSTITKMEFNKDIDEFILTVKNKKHLGFLKDFAKDRDSSTRMTVARETNKLYEIWVDYSTADGYNWGEGYTLNKRNGKREIIWHEQPYKSEPIALDSILPKKEEKPKKGN